MNKRIAIIGCGNLGRAIIQGLLDRGVDPRLLMATRRSIRAIQDLKEVGVMVSADNKEVAGRADIVILSIKPYDVERVLTEIKDELSSETLVVSAATGVTIRQMKDIVGEEHLVFRAMPNTAADVKESLTCICTHSGSEAQLAAVRSVFDQIGQTIVIDEDLMEAATVLGACGIAYVLRFMRGMIQGGIEIGFSAHVAKAIVSQTVKGAAELLITRGQHPEHEIDKVTTPRGCTIAGLNEMEHNGFSSSLIKGIKASYEKIEK